MYWLGMKLVYEFRMKMDPVRDQPGSSDPFALILLYTLKYPSGTPHLLSLREHFQAVLNLPPIFPLYFFYKFTNSLILFLAALGLCCCAQAFSSCSKQGLLFVAVLGLLIAVASLVAEHGL